MRKILFRGLRNNGRGKLVWIYGGYYRKNDLTFIHNEDVGMAVDRKTVGQYTGLKDKNGVKIFEGDVLKLEDYNGKRTVTIKYYLGTFYYTGDGYSDEYIFNGCNFEVIGNIHDNDIEEFANA
jgi:uncharacterized phage protein (TIGR01671 family)